MDFKKKRLDKALEDKIYKVKLVHSKKGWLTIGLTFVTLFSATMLNQKTVDASAVNNVAIANSTTSSSVQLWNSVTSKDMHKANRGLANGTAWKTAKAVRGVDGETYLLVGGNEYANANQMDLADETSSQTLDGIVHVGSGQYAELYTNPMTGAKLITNRALGKNTAWKTDQKVVVDGQTYYRVATNEWVKADDAYLTSESSRSDKTYTKNAPDETTSTDNTNNSSNSNNNSGSHNGGGSTTTPVKKTADIVVKYVDDKGNEIAPAKTLKDQKVDSDVTEKAITVDGYDLTSDATQKVTVSKAGNTITFTYKKTDTTTPTTDEGKVTVKYVDENGKDIADEESTTQKIGTSFLATARSLDGYTVKGDFTKTVTVTKEDTVVTFTYTKDVTPTEKANVTIKSVDENGDSIGTDTTVSREIGTSYIAVAPQNAGYTLNDDNSKTITVSKDSNTVTFKYTKDATTPVDPTADKADVTVNYVDSEGNVLQQAKTLTDKEVGSTISEDAPTIDGYTVDQATKTVTVAKDGSSVITFTYTKDAVAPKTATITTKYVDESGKELATAKSDTAEVGKDFTAKAVDVDGYTVKGDATQTATIDGDKTITFTYTKNAEPVKNATITVKYQLADGTTIQADTTDTAKVGDKYSKDAPTIDGYTLSGDATQSIDSVSGDATLTFTYTKNEVAPKTSTVTVNYVDADGTVLQSAKTDTADIDSTYKADAPAIKGYTVDQQSKSLKVAKDNNVITFTYTKDAPVATVDTSAVSAKVISLVNDYRTSNGLKALNVDANLSAGAVARATTEKGHVDASGDINSANHDEFNAQTQPNLQQYGSTNMAENLAVTSGSTADEVAQNLFNQWKNSPEHNKTMLDASMTDIGVGTQLLANGQYVAIQDFGGNAQSGVTWDSSRFNSATADSFGLTTDQIKQQLQTTYNINLGDKYYVSDHIFKTKNDYMNFINSSFDTPSPLEGSIWAIGGTNGNAGTALVYDANGNAVGWALYDVDEETSVTDAIAEGLTTWIK